MSAASFQLDEAGRVWGERIALRKLSLTIEAGERVALVGPSGSGKTTLLRLLAGTLAASAGRVLADGVDLSSLSRRGIRRHRRRCGFALQGDALVPQLSVHANVVAGRLARWPAWRTLASLLWPLERVEVAALLAEFGLAERQWDVCSELSGGQRQRVAVARALAGDPEVILADEPTAALDPTTAREVTETLLARARERGATLVFCTHRLSLVRDGIDRIIGLRGGEVFIDRPAAEVAQSMLDELYAGSDERR